MRMLFPSAPIPSHPLSSSSPQAVGRFFCVRERNTTLTQEVRGGLVTFLTVGAPLGGWGHADVQRR